MVVTLVSLAANRFLGRVIYISTLDLFMRVRNSHVHSVVNHLVLGGIYHYIYGITMVKNLTSVRFVIDASCTSSLSVAM